MAKFLVHVVRTCVDTYAVQADSFEEVQELSVDEFASRDPLRSTAEESYVSDILQTTRKEIRKVIKAGDNLYTSLVYAEKGSDLSDVIWDIR